MSSSWTLLGAGQGGPPYSSSSGRGGVLREGALWFLLLTLGGAVQGEVFDHRNVYGGVSNGINRCPRMNTCANGKCYDNTQQCNGKNDCGDNSDEWECDVLNRFNASSRKGFVWPWWIVGLTCAVIVFTCVAIICRYVNERTDPSLDTYLLEAPTPTRSRSRPRHRTRDRSRSRTHSRGDEIEMQRKTSRTKRDRSGNTGPRSPKSPRAGRSGETFRARPKGKKVPPPIPPPPHVSPSGNRRDATSNEYTVDIEPLPPPPAPQPTRAAPPVPPVVQQYPVPPPVAPKPKPRTTSGSTAGSENEAASSLPPPPGSPQPPTAWETATSAPIRGGSSSTIETPPPSYREVQVEGYRTLQVDQRSAMARGEESPTNT